LTKLTLETQQHLGTTGARRRDVTTEGLKRGHESDRHGKPISMPVGEGVMGRSST